MNWNDLCENWTKQTFAENQTMAQSIADIKAKAKTLHRRIVFRDRLETVVALLMAPVFAYGSYKLGSDGLMVASAAALMLAIWSLYVPWKLHKARRLIPSAEADLSLLEYLHVECAALQAQYALLSGILRWYLGPPAFGVLVLYTGIKGFGVQSARFALAVLVVYSVIYLLNRVAADKRLAPMITRIKNQIHQLEEVL